MKQKIIIQKYNSTMMKSTMKFPISSLKEAKTTHTLFHNGKEEIVHVIQKKYHSVFMLCCPNHNGFRMQPLQNSTLTISGNN